MIIKKGEKRRHQLILSVIVLVKKKERNFERMDPII